MIHDFIINFNKNAIEIRNHPFFLQNVAVTSRVLNALTVIHVLQQAFLQASKTSVVTLMVNATADVTLKETNVRDAMLNSGVIQIVTVQLF